jgi:hypothetical protein
VRADVADTITAQMNAAPANPTFRICRAIQVSLSATASGSSSHRSIAEGGVESSDVTEQEQPNHAQDQIACEQRPVAVVV